MRRGHTAVIVLILLAIADAVLVFLTVRSTHVNALPIVPVASNPAGATSTSAPSPSGQPSAGPTGRVLLAALTNTHAWRADTPSEKCRSGAKPATIGHSEDGGTTWTQVSVPMTAVSGLSLGGQKMLATGLDASCQPVTYSLSSSATSSTVSTAAAWTVDPKTPTTLLTSGTQTTKKPCQDAIVDTAANSASALVALCSDGSVESTSDTGASWKQLGGPSGIVAIATGGSGNAVYTALRAKCGIAVQPMSSTKTASCVPGTKKWSGPVDMTIVGGTMWLGTADATITEPLANIG